MPLIRPRAATYWLCRLLSLVGAEPLQAAAPDPDDWPSIVECANRHLLTAALAEVLESVAAPDDIVGYCRFLRERNRERNAAIRAQIEDLASVLAAVDISPVLLKGAACLWDGPYADSSVRFVGDIDILVPPSGMARALAALMKGGYRIARRYPIGHNAFGDLTKAGLPSAVDLHAQPVDCRHLLSCEEILSQSRAINCGAATYRIPSTTHRLLHNILHAEVHHLGGYYLGRLPLRDLYECARFSRSDDAPIDWDFIVFRMSEPPLPTVLSSYLLSQRRLFGGVWPLPDGPARNARMHYSRRLLQDRFPWLDGVVRPWGNLRAAFSYHRMKALHGTTVPALRRLCHASNYLVRHTPARAVARLFRG